MAGSTQYSWEHQTIIISNNSINIQMPIQDVRVRMLDETAVAKFHAGHSNSRARTAPTAVHMVRTEPQIRNGPAMSVEEGATPFLLSPSITASTRCDTCKFINPSPRKSSSSRLKRNTLLNSVKLSQWHLRNGNRQCH